MGKECVNVYSNKYFFNCLGDKRLLSNNYKDMYMYINVNVWTIWNYKRFRAKNPFGI